jgi:hypothetical protein
MRAGRFLASALLLVAGLAGVASAQAYSNATGVFTNVGVGIVPAALPPGSLPGDLPVLGPDLYRGTLIVSRNLDDTYSVSFNGETADRAKLNVGAVFASNWGGLKRGTLVVGTSLESDVITGINGAQLLSANINGVGTVDGAFQRVIAKFAGDGSSYPPSLTKFMVNPAPGFLR